MPSTLDSTRRELHRLAAHVLGRRRFEVTGRFGLRAFPGGFGTPAFGEQPDVLRVYRGTLVSESGSTARYRRLPGSTLAELAGFAGADLATPFSCGADGPDLGDVDAPLELDSAAAQVIADWYALGWSALDAAVSGLGESAQATTIQLWPEHFDAGTSLVLESGRGVNLGASPGDDYSNEPYLYVGPHSEERPGDPTFWNASFGALLTRSELASSGDLVGRARRFLATGLALLEK